MHRGHARRQGLYEPQCEHDGCGVGFVCRIDGSKEHGIVEKALEVLESMSHRGAVGADPGTGDGAGLLVQVPHEFFSAEARATGIDLPDESCYGTGLVFLPREASRRSKAVSIIEEAARAYGQRVLWWREVPFDESLIGRAAREGRPVLEQVFIAGETSFPDRMAFERTLYLVRRRAEKAASAAGLDGAFHITSLSSATVTYKGLLTPEQVRAFYQDLSEPSFKSAFGIVHSRYSTNTFPAWDLAQPFRYLAHNGEINTLRGNVNWMKARERSLEGGVFSAEDLDTITPVIAPGLSDSAVLDNVLELLFLSGRSLTEAMALLVPPAWEKDRHMDEGTRAFYRYNSAFMEPWDGPAAVVFTDGTGIGAVLDRNGLRPGRYIMTRSGYVVMASEAGVLDIPASDIKVSGRLGPGKMLHVDTEKGKVLDDREIKAVFARTRECSAWLERNTVHAEELTASDVTDRGVEDDGEHARSLRAYGYTREDINVLMTPMCRDAAEPIGSMGNDTPHALFSSEPQLLFNYFKQLFAQVTNPAIDPIREDIVMSLGCFIASGGNILSSGMEDAPALYVARPVLSGKVMNGILNMDRKVMRTERFDMLFEAGVEGAMERSLDALAERVSEAVEEGCDLIILSDRGVDAARAAIPSLLAVGRVHQVLVERRQRCRVGLIVATGEAREVHHFATLFGYGADCVYPFMAYEVAGRCCADNVKGPGEGSSVTNYRKAIEKGLLKILSKMGISTLQSYKGAQIFEALGLAGEVMEKCFSGTVSRIGGAGFMALEREVLQRHREAFSPEETAFVPELPSGGVYQWKKDGEKHLWSPDSVSLLRQAVRANDPREYGKFSGIVNGQKGSPVTLRSLLRFRATRAIPIEEVEPAEAIACRFATGAMSLGSISSGAHEALAVAMNRLGGMSNTGEGGEDPARFTPRPDGDSARSAIKQVASGRFGVSANYLVNADEIQIKIAQGAKPGEGGQLPGHKVSAGIARIRYTTPGVTLISPPPHHDIYSIEDLAQLIFDLKNVNPRARISVKLVSEVGVGTVAAGVAKAHADMILISGGDGGTGASPKSSIRHAGLPWELGLSETHHTLVMNDLRARVRLQVDGQMRTGRDVAIAAMMGAEEYGFSTSALICLGCVMLRHCHLNNCAMGIATQDEVIQRRFEGSVEHVVNYFNFVIQDLREIMASLGVRTMDELIGRTDLVELDRALLPDKASGVDFSRLLEQVASPSGKAPYRTEGQDHGIEHVLDRELIKRFEEVSSRGGTLDVSLPVRNVNRTVGAMLSGHISRERGEEGLPEGTVKVSFKGVAGQSFGAFLVKGVTFVLEGLANDYVGKGLSGGRIAIYPFRDASCPAEENVLIGNTAFYGATSGEAYINGLAGERFAVRNSGLHAVVEGVGDHGCEYMTGGRIVVIGPTGRNFAAGMSGGIVYVYDPDKVFPGRCNPSMVALEDLQDDDVSTVRRMLREHERYTASLRADKILKAFEKEIEHFVKVMPFEYRKVLGDAGRIRPVLSEEVSDG